MAPTYPLWTPSNSSTYQLVEQGYAWPLTASSLPSATGATCWKTYNAWTLPTIVPASYPATCGTTWCSNSFTAYPTTSTYGVTNAGNWYVWNQAPLKTPAEQLRDIIRERLGPAIVPDRALGMAASIAEERARQTLRRVIGEERYRRYLRNGFLTVRGKTGLVYQIFAGGNMTQVYDKGRRVEKLCVILRGGFPPTDQLIMRYLLILNDETNFRAYANRYQASPSIRAAMPRTDRPLVELFRELKGAAA